MCAFQTIANKTSLVTDVVSADYRTADVFKKYDINFCCGGNWPLETVCMIKGIKIEDLLHDLQMISRNIQIASSLPFHEWSVDFLIDYILNIHHRYIQQTLPKLWFTLTSFVEKHPDKDAGLVHLQSVFWKLQTEMPVHLKEEEDVIFPYIRQLSHAYSEDCSYGKLLVKTLRKPISQIMDQEHKTQTGILIQFRQLTNNYTPPQKSCISHRVLIAKLKELDNDLSQHIYLENEVLFTKALNMERKLLTDET